MLIATCSPYVWDLNGAIPMTKTEYQLPTNRRTPPTPAISTLDPIRNQIVGSLKMMKRTQFPPAPTIISDCAAYEWFSLDHFRMRSRIGFVLGRVRGDLPLDLYVTPAPAGIQERFGPWVFCLPHILKRRGSVPRPIRTRRGPSRDDGGKGRVAH